MIAPIGRPGPAPSIIEATPRTMLPISVASVVQLRPGRSPAPMNLEDPFVGEIIRTWIAPTCRFGRRRQALRTGGWSDRIRENFGRIPTFVTRVALGDSARKVPFTSPRLRHLVPIFSTNRFQWYGDQEIGTATAFSENRRCQTGRAPRQVANIWAFHRSHASIDSNRACSKSRSNMASISDCEMRCRQ